ncbi:unnamed protein product, partial [Amoebophrya sp. A25]|eukprot:GSA25T00025382001.1
MRDASTAGGDEQKSGDVEEQAEKKTFPEVEQEQTTGNSDDDVPQQVEDEDSSLPSMVEDTATPTNSEDSGDISSWDIPRRAVSKYLKSKRQVARNNLRNSLYRLATKGQGMLFLLAFSHMMQTGVDFDGKTSYDSDRHRPSKKTDTSSGSREQQRDLSPSHISFGNAASTYPSSYYAENAEKAPFFLRALRRIQHDQAEYASTTASASTELLGKDKPGPQVSPSQPQTSSPVTLDQSLRDLPRKNRGAEDAVHVHHGAFSVANEQSYMKHESPALSKKTDLREQMWSVVTPYQRVVQ